MYESYGLFIDGRWRQAAEAPFGGIEGNGRRTFGIGSTSRRKP